MPTIIDGTAGITFPNSTIQASAGSVLQVVNATYGTTTSSTINTFADTGLTASITPKFSNSKILVVVFQSGVQKNSGDTTVGLRLLRNSTEILLFDRPADTGSSVTIGIGATGCSYLDSPATASSVTYKTQFRNAGALGTVYVQTGGSTANSTITLMEIAG